MMSNQKNTIVIAEKDPASSAALEMIFSEAGCRVVRFETIAAIKTKRLEQNPCVMLVGDLGGVTFLRKLREEGLEMPVIFLHANYSVSEAVKSIQAGADDYFTRPYCPQTLLKSVLASLEKARRRIEAARTSRPTSPLIASLTCRERQIINLVLAGRLNKEIAEELNLSIVTVKFHRGKAMRKLGARTAGELACKAQELGIAEIQQPLPIRIQPFIQLARQSVAA